MCVKYAPLRSYIGSCVSRVCQLCVWKNRVENWRGLVIFLKKACEAKRTYTYNIGSGKRTYTVKQGRTLHVGPCLSADPTLLWKGDIRTLYNCLKAHIHTSLDQNPEGLDLFGLYCECYLKNNSICWHFSTPVTAKSDGIYGT
jgi:hypothetical protein